MNILRTWIIGVTVTAMVLAAAQAVMPEGAVKRVSRLTGGLVLVLALLHPLMALDTADLSGFAGDLPQTVNTEEAKDAMKPIIEEELGAYIEEKAGELGLSCKARVECQADENGVPLPRTAAVTGELTARERQVLSDLIARDLDIPADRQTFGEG